jgi:catechol 2,3-dioxygenase-like lactoylglutathione lyase family enzyme/predicted enzyme related to lactoylglutathione lyase
LLTPVSLRRDLLVTGPGPDAGGMSQGREPWRHTPEKSGTDAVAGAVPGAAVWVGATAGGAVCPKAGVATAATKVTSKRKSRCIAMATSLSGPPIASWVPNALYNKIGDGARYAEGCAVSICAPTERGLRGVHPGKVLAFAPTRPSERRLIWEDCMKSLIAGLLFASMLSATSAVAQPAPFNDVGVTMGHWHLASKDVEANKKIFVGMGGKWFKIGANEYVMFPGVFVHLNLGTGAGTGGSQGSVVNHVGFIVNNVQEQVAKWKAAGIAVLPGGNNRLDQAYVETPDGLRMEILEDKTQSMPIRHEHVHLFLQEGEIPKAQAWYAKTFGGKAGTRNNAPVVDVPGAQIRFAKADTPQARTLGRVLDHIGFDVKDLKAFITKIEGEGIKLDEPYRETPTGNAITYITDAWGTRIELIKRGPIPAL